MVALPAPRGTLQNPLFPPATDWQPPSISELPSWAGARRVAFDCETKDPDLKELGPSCRRGGGYVVGYSFSIEDGPTHYLPIRHEGGDNMDVEPVLRYLREQAASFEGDLVGGNMQYDLDWSSTDGLEFKRVRHFRDIQIADPLIDEHQMSYSVDAICERHGVPGKDEETLRRAALDFGLGAKNYKKNLWWLPARYVAAYAEQDARALLPVLRRQERIIDDQDLWQVFDLESRVLPILVRMRQRGVRFSWERLRQIEQWSIAQEGEALAEVRQRTGVDIAVGDVWKPEPLARALREIGVVVPHTPKGDDSVTKELLASIDHDVARAIARARKVNKLRTTFAASIRRFAVGDRIHCTFNQLRKTDDDGEQGGAAYGRLSSELPNMQQQPARDELAKPWRKIYLPDEGGEWCSADYSQQEPRWTIHFADLMNCPRAKVAADLYRNDPSTDNHDMMTRMIYGEAAVSGWDKATYKRMRGFCKEIYLGKCYGMGGAKLCRKLGLPTAWTIYWSGRYSEQLERFETHGEALAALRAGGGRGRVAECAGEEGQRIIDKFDSEAPFVKSIAKIVQRRAEQHGYIKTWSGRRCRFPAHPDGGYEWTHKALNRLIQGCSADQTKMAMIAMEEAGMALQLQVHDEIDWTIGSRAEAEEGARIMREVIPLRVPMKVDVEIGPSWGEAA